MRTTVTLEDDVAAEITKLQEARGEPFKQTLNTVLRVGLATLLSNRRSKSARYRTVPVSLGKPRLGNVDDISEVLAFGEGEEHS